MGKAARHYMGKIGVVYMGNIDGAENNTRCTWPEKERLHRLFNSRRSGDTRCQSKLIGNQSQRTNRANSAQPLVLDTGKTIPGGMLRQLISDYRDQVARKQALIEQTENEIDFLQSRIAQFEELAEELEEPTEESA